MPPIAKELLTTDGAKRLTLFREGRTIPPKSADFLPFQMPTTPQKSASTNFCLDSSVAHTYSCTLASHQIEALLPVSKTWLPFVARESTEGTPKNFMKPWAPPPRNPPRSYELQFQLPNPLASIHQRVYSSSKSLFRRLAVSTRGISCQQELPQEEREPATGNQEAAIVVILSLHSLL